MKKANSKESAQSPVPFDKALRRLVGAPPKPRPAPKPKKPSKKA